MSNSSKIYLTLTGTCLAIFFLLVLNWFFFLRTPLLANNVKPVTFVYTQGSSVRGLVKHLHSQGVLKHPLFFLALAKLEGNIYSLRAGQYQIDPGMTPSALIQRMVKGEVLMHSFTIIDGWTFHQVINALRTNPYITHEVDKLTDDNIMKAIGHEGEMPEGRFAPDTYLFHFGIKDKELLKLSYNLMQKRVYQSWLQRAKNSPWKCPYETLIVASIIEKETASLEEQPKVAGVIMRRLQKNMTLGMDSTVLYGLNKDVPIIGKITSAEWRKDTAYNTYLHHGLPPTPIAMPSFSSMQAALHPEEGNSLYFVGIGNTGLHKFSSTLKEHNAAVKKYMKK